MTQATHVFLSSTYSDLATHRGQVMDVLARFGMVYKGMEYFGASQDIALDVCLKQLAGCDLVIVILGTRYGSCPPDSQKSFTELEIEHAKKLGVPIHVYLLDQDRHPVIWRHVDSGEAAERLAALRERLMKERLVAFFISPEDLAVKIARDLYEFRPHEGTTSPATRGIVARGYRECVYDYLATWYDPWYQDHYRDEEPFETIKRIARPYYESERGNLKNKTILDCACGTGNTFVAFTKAGYTIYGSDGSQEMLLRAEQNCANESVSADKLLLTPINWTDLDGYRQHFDVASFDIIVNTANSFCHIPPTPEYMQTALANFNALLKAGGLLVIDTKRYVRSDPVGGVPTHKELKYDAQAQEWIERFERKEMRSLPGLGEVYFHTRLMYDTDPAFSSFVRRALIIITIYGENLAPKTLVIPYYPLPARLLHDQMTQAGFETKTIPAMTGEAANWKYDVVVGQKK